MTREQNVILTGVLINKKQQEIDEINELLNEKLDWIEIIGQLVNHRLCGYFYYGIQDCDKDKVPREIYIALQLMVKSIANDMKEKMDDTLEVLNELEKTNIHYAGLKGIVFFSSLYEFGIRRSNDIDLLVLEDDLDELDRVMKKLGFVQSDPHNEEIKEVSKRDKVIQRLNYHDLIPYLKKTEHGVCNLDINFLFDSNKNIIEKKVFEMGTQLYSKNGYTVRGLTPYTNLAHLCAHFHREATNIIWTRVEADMVLYKLVDIINYVREYSDKLKKDEYLSVVRKLNLEEQVYYVFYVLSQFYTNDFISEIEEQLRPKDDTFLMQISVDADNKIQRINGFVETAFMNSRGIQ